MCSSNNDFTSNIKQVVLTVKVIITATTKHKIMTNNDMLIIKIKGTVKSKIE